MTTLPSLQTALEQHRDQMAKRIRTVYALEKFCNYPFNLGRREYNGRSRLLHELLIPTLITVVGPLVLATIDPMHTPDQTVAFNRIRVQDIAL